MCLINPSATEALVHSVAALLDTVRNGKFNSEAEQRLQKAESLLAALTDAPAGTQVDCKAIMEQTNGVFDTNLDAYVVLYRHGRGNSSYLVMSDHEPSEDEICKSCEICFEPEIGENLIVELLLTKPVQVSGSGGNK